MRLYTRWLLTYRPHLLVILALLLAGCGGGAGRATATPQVSGAHTPVVTQLPRLLAFNAPASVDTQGLLVRFGGLNCGASVMLASERTSYDVGAIDQMTRAIRAFVTATYFGAMPYTPAVASKQPPLPATLLRVVPGAQTCSAALTLTNTGRAPVELTSFGVTLAADPVRNTLAYRLIDVCTLFSNPHAECGVNFSLVCSLTFDLHLRGGTTGTQSAAPIMPMGPHCGSTLLEPSQTVGIAGSIDSIPANLIYRLRLALGVQTAQGGLTVALPSSFDSNAVFVDASQLSCYGLHDTAFVPTAVRHDEFASLCL